MLQTILDDQCVCVLFSFAYEYEQLVTVRCNRTDWRIHAIIYEITADLDIETQADKAGGGAKSVSEWKILTV